ncbi:DMT family transporter [Lentibacillus sp. Marseille-P4043]|uniref:DMT family transporter n=1 Tax=Lentibacillus sp. Marseille-P4043 TaxID=2040293 RepID=UPI000D0BCFAB|nr:multidrug efflux SMR transporter [Lentibacillus sp. Marseille-P4043]
MNAYILLAISIVSEVFGSSMLKATNGFKKIIPSLGVIVGYGIAFYGLSLSLKMLHLGVAYAIWAGLGTALTALVGVTIYKENFNGKKLFGLVLIIGGVIFLNIDGVH